MEFSSEYGHRDEPSATDQGMFPGQIIHRQPLLPELSDFQE
jgi:hypothetical protein